MVHLGIFSKALQAARFRVLEAWGAFCTRSAGVSAGRELKAVGAPIVTIFPRSQITLGSGVTLISKSFATALGVHHQVILRTLAEGARIEIGDGTGISGGSICAAKLVLIGRETRIGANVVIADTDFHSLQPASRSGHSHPSIGVSAVRIGSRVLIGTNSIILKGVSIGDNTVIGAGSVVTRAIPPDSIAAGNPCRVIRALTPLELGSLPDARMEAVQG